MAGGRQKRDEAAVSARASSSHLHRAYQPNFGKACSQPRGHPRHHPSRDAKLQATACFHFFPLGRSNEVGHTGTGSKWYYIHSWAMCWPTNYTKKSLTGKGADASAERAARFQTVCKQRQNVVRTKTKLQQTLCK